jgi:FkbM family methyltransferase
MQTDPNAWFYFNHVPKTAGTTLRFWLESFYDENRRCPFFHEHEVLDKAWVFDGRYAFFSGHLRMLPHHYFSSGLTAFTCLRKPLEHAVSLLSHIQREPDPADFYIDSQKATRWDNSHRSENAFGTKECFKWIEYHLKKSGSLSRFSAVNYQSRYLAGMDFTLKAEPDLMFDRASDYLNRCLVVGLVEHLQDSVDLLCYKMAWPAFDLGYVANQGEQMLEFPKEYLDAIDSAAVSDKRLYALAEARLENECLAMRRDLGLPDHADRGGFKAALRERFLDLRRPVEVRHSSRINFSAPLWNEGFCKPFVESSILNESIAWVGPSVCCYVYLPLPREVSFELRIRGIHLSDSLYHSLVIRVDGYPCPHTLIRDHGVFVITMRVPAIRESRGGRYVQLEAEWSETGMERVADSNAFIAAKVAFAVQGFEWKAVLPEDSVPLFSRMGDGGIFDALIRASVALNARVDRLCLDAPLAVLEASKAARPSGRKTCRVLVVPNEICDLHGTGVLVRRLFGDGEGVVCIRSHEHYRGQHRFGEQDRVLFHPDGRRDGVLARVSQCIADLEVTEVFAIPFFESDFLTAWAVQVLSGAPMGVFVMDDQYLLPRIIPEKILRLTLEAAAIRFAISPQMRDGYEAELGLKFHVIPPLADPDLLTKAVVMPDPIRVREPRAVLVGSVWNPEWLKRLGDLVALAGVEVDWYGNYNPDFHKLSLEQLSKKGIHPKGVIGERELAPIVACYPFALLPLSPSLEADDWSYLTRYSLQCRIAFIVACCGTPVLSLSAQKGANAAFIEKHGIGKNIAYSKAEWKQAVEAFCHPETQLEMRINALKIAPLLSAGGAGQWIWQSIQEGIPADGRFDVFERRDASNLTPWIEGNAPKGIPWYFVDTLVAIRRLAKSYPLPDHVFDVGASTGVWSHHVKLHAFPGAQYSLFEPLLPMHRAKSDHYAKNNPDFLWYHCALSDEPGEVSFQVSEDLYGSSLLDVADGRVYRKCRVEAKTLDSVCALPGYADMKCGFLKLDVQGAEHLILKGGGQCLDRFAYALLEVSLRPMSEGGPGIEDILQMMSELGFTVFDWAGDWRSPIDGALIQQDILFIRRHLVHSLS